MRLRGASALAPLRNHWKLLVIMALIALHLFNWGRMANCNALRADSRKALAVSHLSRLCMCLFSHHERMHELRAGWHAHVHGVMLGHMRPYLWSGACMFDLQCMHVLDATHVTDSAAHAARCMHACACGMLSWHMSLSPFRSKHLPPICSNHTPPGSC